MLHCDLVVNHTSEDYDELKSAIAAVLVVVSGVAEAVVASTRRSTYRII